MKISEATIKILKNYSGINNGILFKPGNVITTVSSGYSTILSLANVQETFPIQAPIFNLEKFLATQNLFKNPDFDFQGEKVVISENNRSVDYFYADMTAIKIPKKIIPVPETEVIFELTKEDFKSIFDSAAVLGYQELVIRNNDGKILVETTKSESGLTAGNFQLDTKVETNETFHTTLVIDNIKILSGNYVLRVAPEFVHFQSKDLDLQYWVIKQAAGE